MVYQFLLPPWDSPLVTSWEAPIYHPSLMAQQVSHDLAAVAAPSLVKLGPYDEDEPVIWFHLIEAQFAAAEIQTQKLKYANALANLPKQVFWNIFLFDTVDACNISDHPFDDLKAVFLGQFGKGR